MTTKARTFSPKVRERVVRMLQEHAVEYPRRWAEQPKVPATRSIAGMAAEGAVESVAAKAGCAARTLYDWTKKKAEAIHRRKPWCRARPSSSPRWNGWTGSTAAACSNPIGCVPPAKAEASFYAVLDEVPLAA